jgi:hypothetical protein
VTLPSHAYVIYTPAIHSAPTRALESSVFKPEERHAFSALAEEEEEEDAWHHCHSHSHLHWHSNGKAQESSAIWSTQALRGGGCVASRGGGGSAIWSTQALSPRHASVPAPSTAVRDVPAPGPRTLRVSVRAWLLGEMVQRQLFLKSPVCSNAI